MSRRQDSMLPLPWAQGQPLVRARRSQEPCSTTKTKIKIDSIISRGHPKCAQVLKNNPLPGKPTFRNLAWIAVFQKSKL